MFPFAIATTLGLKLQVDGTLLVLAKVVTCGLQVGNRRSNFGPSARFCATVLIVFAP
jgi:hypothetical protein